MDSDLPDDAVEMIRAIRNRHNEETKSMTIEEKWTYDRKGIDEFKRLMQEVNPNDYDLSWLHKK